MIDKLLDELFDLQCQSDYLRIDKQDKIKSVIPQEVQQTIMDIEVEYASIEGAINDKIGALTESIKDQVKVSGGSVKSTHLMAVYSKARTSWDSKGLEGFAVAHPEINVFKKLGEPSVSIKVK